MNIARVFVKLVRKKAFTCNPALDSSQRVKTCHLFSTSASRLNLDDQPSKTSDRTDDFIQWLESESSSPSTEPSPLSKHLSQTFADMGLKRPVKTTTVTSEPLGEDDVPELDLQSGPTFFESLVDNDNPLYEVTPFVWTEKIMESLHSGWGLSWSTSILLGASIFRLASLKLDLIGERYFTSQLLAAPKENELFLKYKAAEAKGDSKEMKLTDKLRAQNLRKGNVPSHGRKLLNVGLQLGMVVCQVIAVDRLSVAHAQGLMDSSFYWIPHLALPDPQGVLPVVSALSVALLISNRNLRMMTTQSSLDKLMIGVVHVFSFAASYVVYVYCVPLPSHINLVVAFNAISTLILRMAFCAKPVRKMLNLPQVQGSFTTDIFRKSRPAEKGISFNDKAEKSKGRLRAALSDLRMVFKDPEKIKGKYLAMHEQKKRAAKAMTDQSVVEAKKT